MSTLENTCVRSCVTLFRGGFFIIHPGCGQVISNNGTRWRCDVRHAGANVTIDTTDINCLSVYEQMETLESILTWHGRCPGDLPRRGLSIALRIG